MVPFITPILLIVFNRPLETEKVLAAIRAARPPRLYIASDAARAHKPGEAEQVEAVRRLVEQGIDWPCDVKTFYRRENAGCKIAVSGAIDWFFAHEEQGIVLEDDCLPHRSFFMYCQTMLERYADDARVMAVHGCNFQRGVKRGSGSYYFSRFIHVWGWASWRRAWALNDVALGFWPHWRESDGWNQHFHHDPIQKAHWQKVFNRMHANKVDTWDHAWVASIMHAKGLVVAPNTNLISNIGFGANATHTTSFDALHANQPLEPLGPVVHPPHVAVDEAADRYTFDHSFGGRNKRMPRRLLFLHKDVKRWWRGNV
jgi:hypothetical protein